MPPYTAVPVSDYQYRAASPPAYQRHSTLEDDRQAEREREGGVVDQGVQTSIMSQTPVAPRGGERGMGHSPTCQQGGMGTVPASPYFSANLQLNYGREREREAYDVMPGVPRMTSESTVGSVPHTHGSIHPRTQHAASVREREGERVRTHSPTVVPDFSDPESDRGVSSSHSISETIESESESA
ncbi:hypothetical protein KIPB_000936 [Kipferlia bialata]|uniref:Uncharacterized protein n=1 Tax=Kipferlia bialata TaxID=797122 RepID=A0A9K3CN15_9EUKA|nr:hypothetical protein KIPB_000936 [Kipferlia bialata]|eukprot:g936.t1